MFFFPLPIGAVRVATLSVYRSGTGPLPVDVYADALVAADMITRLILAWQPAAPPGMLAFELRHDGSYQAVVQQASGMISAQLAIGVGDALALLRARAFAGSASLGDLAADVVARRTRIDD